MSVDHAKTCAGISKHEKRLISCEKMRKFGNLRKSCGLYSFTTLNAAGFHRTNEPDTFQCADCGLKFSEKLQSIHPLRFHYQESPTCVYIQHYFLECLISAQRKTLHSTQNHKKCLFKEGKRVVSARERTFSHWPDKKKPSAAEMIYAGLFACNVEDRTLCIYCNKIFQRWKETDNPSTVHKILSPTCPYVCWMLNDQSNIAPTIINSAASDTQNESNDSRSIYIDYWAPGSPQYSNITKRIESFATWTNTTGPTVEVLAKAGFFYSGTASIVSCFYCNGSLQNWGHNDDPIIEHVRWFSQCLYAKQICGDDLYKQVQLAKRVHQERKRLVTDEQIDGHNAVRNVANDSDLLTRHTAARLDCDISQHALDGQTKLAVVRRCWEDQLKLKGDDFVEDTDLLTACLLLEKQMEHIQGRVENIIIPHVALALNSNQQQSDSVQAPPVLDQTTNQQEAPRSQLEQTTSTKSTKVENRTRDESLTETNSCSICFQETRQLACVPCGHLAACVSCGYSLKTCPICRHSIKAFIRVYL